MILRGPQRLKSPQGVRTFFLHCSALGFGGEGGWNERERTYWPFF